MSETNMTITGVGRIVDFSPNGATCRVRLYNNDGLPTGKVLTGVKYIPGNIELDTTASRFHVANMSDDELNTIARQNMCYNSHFPVVIE